MRFSWFSEKFYELDLIVSPKNSSKAEAKILFNPFCGWVLVGLS